MSWYEGGPDISSFTSPIYNFFYKNPSVIWYGAGIAAIFYIFVYPYIVNYLRSKELQKFQKTLEEQHSDHIRAARLKQGDALREAVKLSKQLEEKKPKKKEEEKKKPKYDDFVPFGAPGSGSTASYNRPKFGPSQRYQKRGG